jgi:methylmalonyl-CoA/ethylmalonyl-CoA epimerase
MIRNVDHIGIATTSLEQGLALYQGVLGLKVASREIIADQGVEVLAFQCAGADIELLQPTRADCSIAKFLAERGSGMHHVAYRVDDIRGALEHAREAGIELVDQTPRVGAGGHLVAFLHPRSTGRVLIELVEHTS